MANAAPNAFGAQLAYPGRQTIALCGDGGFTMLGLPAQHGLTVSLRLTFLMR